MPVEFRINGVAKPNIYAPGTRVIGAQVYTEELPISFTRVENQYPRILFKEEQKYAVGCDIELGDNFLGLTPPSRSVTSGITNSSPPPSEDVSKFSLIPENLPPTGLSIRVDSGNILLVGKLRIIP